MKNYLKLSCKNLIVYVLATLLSMISLSQASNNPLTSGEFDEALENIGFKKVFQFAYKKSEILEIQIGNIPKKSFKNLENYTKNLLDISALNSDKQFWEIVQAKINNDNLLNNCEPHVILYDREFTHKNSIIEIRFTLQLQNKPSKNMHSNNDFDSNAAFYDYLSGLLKNFIYGLANDESVKNNLKQRAELDALKIKEEERTKALWDSMYS